MLSIRAYRALACGLLAAAMLAVLCAAPARSAAAEVLVVGDSLEVLTSPYLKQDLPGISVKVNAVGGYNSYQIRELFEESYEPSQRVIVFDAGTNDNPAYPQILAENLSRVAQTVGNRCMVVPTIHGFVVNGVNNDGKNRVVREFAASRPGTQVPEWAGWVHTHKDLMADELHPGPEGAELRARLIAHGVMACLGLAPSVQSASAPAAPATPALESRPETIEPVDRMATRETELIGAVTAALLGQAAASMIESLTAPAPHA
jgi:lysophospholipase L1-like esterase